VVLPQFEFLRTLRLFLSGLRGEKLFAGGKIKKSITAKGTKDGRKGRKEIQN
jgi:hypothetical protein